jgi:excisionase family DNA binding protein
MHFPDYCCMQTESLINLSRKDAAQRLGISLRTLDYIISNGLLPVRKIGRRSLISVRALEQFAKRDHVSVKG